ncbi:MAG: FlgD immunoglobulin-like domain containing protein [Candidatus Eisenbacteria bacterium]
MNPRRKFRRRSSRWNPSALRFDPLASIDLFVVVPLGLSLTLATPADGATFESRPILPEAGVNVFGADVARAQWSRQLMGDAWSVAVLAHSDLFDRIPYVEEREFLIVSDPAWNRLLTGESEVGLGSWNGEGNPLGALREPRGLAVDENDRVYICDTGNDRVVVLQAHTEWREIALEPLFSIDGVSRPYALAISDRGTPFAPADDRLYIAETGKNRVVRYDLGVDGARFGAALGELGSGVGAFAGPTAIAVDARGDLIVADAHNRRLVRLRDQGDHLEWIDSTPTPFGLVTALAADPWGNVHAVCPEERAVVRLDSALRPVTSLTGGFARPRGVDLVTRIVRDHRSGAKRRLPEASALVLDEWGAGSGLSLWHLGLEVSDARRDERGVLLGLSDAAEVTLRSASGETIAAARLGAGESRLPLPAGLALSTLDGARVVARSLYPNGEVVERALDSMAEATGELRVESIAPNPSPGAVRFGLLLARPDQEVELRVYNLEGRLVRRLGSDPAGASSTALTWDGRDEGGRPVGSGLYFYRVRQGESERAGRVVLLR